jgi:hypothetical protein
MALSPLARFETKLASVQSNDPPLKITARSKAAIEKQAAAKGATDVMERLSEITGGPGVRKTRKDAGYVTQVVSTVPGDNQDPSFDDPTRVLSRPEGGGTARGGLKVYNLGTGGSAIFGFKKAVDGAITVFGNDFPGHIEKAQVNGITPSGEVVPLGVAEGAPTFSSSANKIPPQSKKAGGDRFTVPAGKKIKWVELIDLNNGGNGFDVDSIHGQMRSRR